jgi:hypothetical protein
MRERDHARVSEHAPPATDPGLCASCAHASVVRGARSAFWMCGLAATDPSFPRYPRLPVLECRGYQRREAAPTAPAAPADPPP